MTRVFQYAPIPLNLPLQAPQSGSTSAALEFGEYERALTATNVRAYASAFFYSARRPPWWRPDLTSHTRLPQAGFDRIV